MDDKTKAPDRQNRVMREGEMDEITNDQIEILRAEAGEAGDLEQVTVCDRALAGDDDARADCAAVIMVAKVLG